MPQGVTRIFCKKNFLQGIPKPIRCPQIYYMLVYHQESWRKMASIIDLIIIYTMTIITSKAIYNKYDCKLSNDLADKGLKIKKETLNEIYINIKRHIFPIINIITAIIMYKNYNKNNPY